MKVIYLTTLAAALSLVSAQSDPRHGVGYDERFVEGVLTHTAGQWKKCMPYFRRSLEEFSKLEEARRHCYSLCSRKSSKVTTRWADLNFFGSILERSHCVRHCTEEEAGLLPRGAVSLTIERALRMKEGLSFLQSAYHQLGAIGEAARACTQYFYYNPHNDAAKEKFHMYKRLRKVTKDDLKPGHILKYRDLFEIGHKAYHAEDWSLLVESMESGLLELFSSLEDCRRDCTGPLKIEDIFGFSELMTEVQSKLLDCQNQCSRNLGMFRTDKTEEFFGSYFHYLEYGYYFLNRSRDAVSAVATRVRLDPSNEEARRSAVFYKQRPGVTTKDFKPREDVIPEILKHEAILKYGKLIKKLCELTENTTEHDEDMILLEEDFKKWPVVAMLLEHSTQRNSASE
ncbi:cartilage-associated protein-like [Halichondria panicea]|uniref:cartilage-associated protein-like n=1 Tax=Halichondria panicea TaxID=6063 RepID=UPI00312B3C8B